jgi:hypothetical protein
MGTYIKYKAPDDRRQVVDKWLIKESNGALGLWNERDQSIERAKKNGGCPDFLPLGAGQFKLSGDEEIASVVDVLIRAREKWGVECFDVPSNVGDYIAIERLAKLIDLPAWQRAWTEEEAQEKIWTRARNKARREASKQHRGGGPMTVQIWGLDRANVMFTRMEATDHPAWVGVSYNQKWKWHITTERNEWERFELLRDQVGRGFLALPLMALGNPEIKDGFNEVRDYLVRARRIGLAEHPDSIMVGVYGCLPAKIDFGRSVSQPAAPHGPFVRGVHVVKTGRSYSSYTEAVIMNMEGGLEWGRLGGQRATLLVREHKPDREDTGVAAQVLVSYPALGKLLTEPASKI